MVKRQHSTPAPVAGGALLFVESHPESGISKVRLAVAINDILGKSHLSQAAAAERLGISQPKISPLANCRLEGFSVPRLLNFLNALGRDVEIIIRRPASRRSPRIHVTAP